MNITDIKYCIEEFKPEGFELFNNKIIQTPSGLCIRIELLEERKSNHVITLRRWDKEILPLLISRVIEGINKNTKYILSFEYSDGWYRDIHFINNGFREFTKPDVKAYKEVDEAKKVSIKYIIDKVRG